MPGRPAIPTKLKLIQGTLNVTRALKHEFSPTILDGIPSPPSILDIIPKAKELWIETATELSNKGILSSVDLPMLAAYCIEMAEYLRSMERVKKEGSVIKNVQGNRVTNPNYYNAKNSLDKAIKIANSFGFTPASRTKIAMSNKSDDDDSFFR
jgi:P27 family predicted phage terminase small subunit